MDMIKVETEAFSGVAVAMYELPFPDVLLAMTTEGGAQLMRMTKLLKLAVVPGQVAELEALSFQEYSAVLESWASLSVRAGSGEKDLLVEADWLIDEIEQG